MKLNPTAMLAERLTRLLRTPKLKHLVPDELKVERERNPADNSEHLTVRLNDGHALVIHIPASIALGTSTLKDIEELDCHASGHAVKLPNPVLGKGAFMEALLGLPIPGYKPPGDDSLSLAEWRAKYGETPQCPKCKAPLRWNNNHEFWGCTKWRETGCKGSLNPVETPTGDTMYPPQCPDCGGAMRERDSSRGRFWGCGNYPDCGRTMDGHIGDAKLTELVAWMPEPGKPLIRTVAAVGTGVAGTYAGMKKVELIKEVTTRALMAEPLAKGSSKKELIDLLEANDRVAMGLPPEPVLVEDDEDEEPPFSGNPLSSKPPTGPVQGSMFPNPEPSPGSSRARKAPAVQQSKPAATPRPRPPAAPTEPEREPTTVEDLRSRFRSGGA